jgi:hypothetical protein
MKRNEREKKPISLDDRREYKAKQRSQRVTPNTLILNLKASKSLQRRALPLLRARLQASRK